MLNPYVGDMSFSSIARAWSAEMKDTGASFAAEDIATTRAGGWATSCLRGETKEDGDEDARLDDRTTRRGEERGECERSRGHARACGLRASACSPRAPRRTVVVEAPQNPRRPVP